MESFAAITIQFTSKIIIIMHILTFWPLGKKNELVKEFQSIECTQWDMPNNMVPYTKL